MTIEEKIKEILGEAEIEYTEKEYLFNNIMREIKAETDKAFIRGRKEGRRVALLITK